MKRSRFTLIFLLPLIAAACLLIIFLIGAPLGIPDLAAQSFGPASPALDTVDKVYLSAMLLLEKNSLTAPTNPIGGETTFQVALGESPLVIIDRLQALGLIRNAETMRHYLVYTGIDTQIQAGEYTLSPIMSPIEIAQALRDPTPSDVDFVVLAGWRTEEVANALPTSGLNISPDDFLTAARNPSSEGFLFPGTYTLSRDTSAELLIRTLVSAFHEAATPEIEAGLTQQGLSLQEAVTLASIVQRESVSEDEMPLIASVFLNRLAVGMKLDADPTVQYALGYNPAQGTWWTNPLSAADLEAESPYNTYRNFGLPPGAICNPGINALKAVAFPAQTPYYYFRAACDGSGRHLFAETFEEHVGNACP